MRTKETFMYEPLEIEFKKILDAETKSEMIALIHKYKDHITNSPNLTNFYKAAVYTDNKLLLQAFNETKIFESQAIDYSTRIGLLDNLANSYSYAYGGDFNLSTAQSDALKIFKNSNINIVKDEFSRVKSSLQVLQKEHPELINRLKPYYFPENFLSEIIELAKINTNNDKSKVRAEVNKTAEEFKNNITLITMLERSNHVMAIKNTINYVFIFIGIKTMSHDLQQKIAL